MLIYIYIYTHVFVYPIDIQVYYNDAKGKSSTSVFIHPEALRQSSGSLLTLLKDLGLSSEISKAHA